jgi:prophage regulatory protein
MTDKKRAKKRAKPDQPDQPKKPDQRRPPQDVAGARILRLKAVQDATGLSRSAIYSGMRKGAFPRAVKLSERSIGWSERSIMAWVAERPAA